MSSQPLEVIDIQQIKINPYQPRKEFAHDELHELRDSITSVGLIHPPTVRKDVKDGSYELISGERRLRACRLAGLDKIPVYVVELEDEVSAQAALIENLQRVDLNPLEVAAALEKMASLHGLTQAQLAKKVGKKRSTIANYLRLLTMDSEFKQALVDNKISMGHAKVILSLEHKAQKRSLLKDIIDKKLSVRQAEKQVKQSLSSKVSQSDIENVHLENILEAQLGTKVKLQAKKDGSGTLSISFFSLDDFDRLLEHMQIKIEG